MGLIDFARSLISCLRLGGGLPGLRHNARGLLQSGARRLDIALAERIGGSLQLRGKLGVRGLQLLGGLFELVGERLTLGLGQLRRVNVCQRLRRAL